jgi:hypothetical protein
MVITKSEQLRTRDKESNDFDAVVIQFVQSREYVSFIELQAFIESRGIPAHGTWAIHPLIQKHIIFWHGLSESLYHCIQRLITSRRLFFHRANPFVYAIDGERPRLPLAKTGRESFYAWLPVVLCTFPSVKVGAA